MPLLTKYADHPFVFATSPVEFVIDAFSLSDILGNSKFAYETASCIAGGGYSVLYLNSKTRLHPENNPLLAAPLRPVEMV